MRVLRRDIVTRIRQAEPTETYGDQSIHTAEKERRGGQDLGDLSRSGPALLLRHCGWIVAYGLVGKALRALRIGRSG